VKKRIRTLIRKEGWHLVEKREGYEKYMEMRKWCTQTYSPGTWEGKSVGDHFESGTKKFVFKHDRDKLMFVLRWS
jgi:hypothetical protein